MSVFTTCDLKINHKQMGYCKNCGSKSYNGACTNCDEELYILEQYDDLSGTEFELPYPDKDSEFMKRANKSLKRIKNEHNV